MFKKKKLQKKKTNNRVVNIFWLIVIFSVFILWIITLSFAKNFDFFNVNELSILSDLNNESTTETIKNKENKESDKINILLLGRWWITNDAPNLTDSIILASINKKTKTISMFSIPRDLYVEYYDWKSWKINKTYALARAKTWSVEAWIDAIKYNIELLTKQKIDYYVDIDFNWFIKFIDAIGWVKITLEENFIDTQFPDNNWGYRTFFIKKWTWNFDWETALNYARSRHSTSDFDRWIRQQQIIESVRNKLNEGWFFSKLSKAKAFYDVFKKYVKTDIWLTDTITIFNEVNNSNYKIVSSNINDSCFDWDPLCIKWWFLYTPERVLYWWASVLLVNGSGLWNINNYKELEKYIYIIFENPTIFKENIVISVLNSTKVSLLAWSVSFELRKYWINIPFNWKSISSIRWEIIEKSFINYIPEIKNSETIKFFREIFTNIEFIEVDELEYSLDIDSKIEIIIWQDYEKIFSDLENNL